MTRGQRGSLALRCVKLSFTAPCRFDRRTRSPPSSRRRGPPPAGVGPRRSRPAAPRTGAAAGARAPRRIAGKRLGLMVRRKACMRNIMYYPWCQALSYPTRPWGAAFSPIPVLLAHSCAPRACSHDTTGESRGAGHTRISDLRRTITISIHRVTEHRADADRLPCQGLTTPGR